jgi:hypothetical protein
VGSSPATSTINFNEEVTMTDYQTDYKIMYEELRALVRLYFEIMYDDGTVYDEDDWADALQDTELDLCLLVGLIDEEDLDD